jgi:Vacuolar sorting protein 39 domain 2
LTTVNPLLIPFQVLELLPDEWPVNVVKSYFLQAFRKATDEKLQAKIVLGLSRGENLMASGL